MKNLKYFLHSILLLLALSIGVASCDLDKSPYSSINESEADWTKVSTAQRFRTGIYASLRGRLGGVAYYAPDYQSDLFNATIGFGNNGGDLTRWTFTFGQGDVESFWAGNYGTIKNVNYVLGNLSKVEAQNDEEKAFIKNLEGECKLVRAICYHGLVLRFAKDYEPGTAATEPGLPIVTEVDFEAKPERSTLEDTYKFIKQDIADARANILAQGKANAVYLSSDVVDAFEARVDLYMHNYKNAVALVKKVVDKYPLAESAEDYLAMWKKDESSEILYRGFSSIDERYNGMSMYTSGGLYRMTDGSQMTLYTAYYVPTEGALSLYEKDDVRFGAFFKQDYVLSAQEIDALYLLYKFPGNESLKKDPATNPFEYFHMHKPFRVAELYLIAAESAYFDGNEALSKEWLNKLRTARGSSQLEVTGSDLFKALQEEWIREFIGEGMRLDQLKRWNLGFKRMSPQHSGFEPEVISPLIKGGSDFDELEIPAGHEKFVWEIPQNDLIANPNLTPNWK